MTKISKYIRCALLVLVGITAILPAVAGPSQASSQNLVATSQPQVRVSGNRVEITVPNDGAYYECPVTIYALTGQVVKSLQAAPGVTGVELPRGYYIVKCDRVSCRVLVK